MSDTPAATVFLSTEIFYPELPGGLRQYFRYGPGLFRRGVQMRVVFPRRSPDEPAHERVNEIDLVRVDPPDGLGQAALRGWLAEQAFALALAAGAPGTVLQPGTINWEVRRVIRQARTHGFPGAAVFGTTTYASTPPSLNDSF